MAEFRGRVRTTLERITWLECDNDGQIAGNAYASQFRTRAGYRWACELTVYVDPEYHRYGIRRALYSSLFRCLALQGYCIAVAVITIPNPASIALHDSMGMRHIGTCEKAGYKHGRWLGVGFRQIELQPIPTEPDPPMPWRQIAASPLWHEALGAGLPHLKL